MKKRFLLSGFGGVAAGLLLTSVAYACTTYVGHMEVTGNGPGSGTVETDGANEPGQMKYCDTVTDLGLPVVGAPYGGKAIIERAATTRTLTIDVSPSPVCTGPGANPSGNFLPTGEYFVTYKHTGFVDSTFVPGDEDPDPDSNNNKDEDLTRQYIRDCMASASGAASGGGTEVDPGNKLTVTNGVGSETFTFANNTENTWSFGNDFVIDEAIVCVSVVSGTQWGNQAPFFIQA